MRRALDLAARGSGLVAPNPLVGAVLVRHDRVVGEGWHGGPGQPHAEVRAMEAAGPDARGGTLYVTLEPCIHQGRTPPCVPRVIEAGVRRVVVATLDPYPLVDGRGVGALLNAGVEVEVGPLAAEAARQNAGFLKHVRTGLPFVTLKMAASLDGKAAARDGSSKWITGEGARREVHAMRAGSDAIMVGAGTAYRDDPSLTVRLADPPKRSPLRVVVDGRGIVPASHRLFTDGEAPTLVATTEGTPEDRRLSWEEAGAEVLVLGGSEAMLVPLDQLVAELGKRDVQRVLLEGGPTLAWEAVRSGVVDEVVLFIAPILIGGREAPSVLMGDGIARIGEPHRLDIVEVDRVGEDIKVVADVHRDH
ncbi:MAG: bifunctional diaminohydroxyphosphoribosylaminopyrimidine deaminase/5-amino-6-(5-phosphoribosylamino)uracil reductase RibD [Actinomycetota bacterium]|nr:bifunctional diaminohydroxyphosphoribosylaminopyrimidine deaminase/5-amino-6-(5-phosphoribosylamino)uracil reductase RibD [Actinomycetota bacterium]